MVSPPELPEAFHRHIVGAPFRGGYSSGQRLGGMGSDSELTHVPNLESSPRFPDDRV